MDVFVECQPLTYDAFRTLSIPILLGLIEVILHLLEVSRLPGSLPWALYCVDLAFSCGGVLLLAVHLFHFLAHLIVELSELARVKCLT